MGYIVGAVAIAVLLIPRPDCPPEFRMGQTYHEVQQGPCPDLDSIPKFRASDSVHVGYYCPSKRVVVVGDVTTGKMDAFFLYTGN